MTLHSETITDAMAAIAKVIFEVLDEQYYLAGGTALALRLGHRKSVDLDYFINKEIDTLHLKNEILELFPSAKTRILFEEKNTLWCFINGVKVSFISRFDTLLEPIEIVDNFRLAGLKDITVMKLSAICGREEYKDYFDLACIAGVTDSRAWVEWWSLVYPQVDSTSFIVALAYANQMPPVPLDAYNQIDVKKILSATTEAITDVIS
ncbi:MAG: nucleotidyl transferase AbiEii/AbiGii toxin family protein [Minisyncoccota bacterium]